MSDEISDQLDEQVDLAGEGLRAPDELDLEADRVDRAGGESLKESSDGAAGQGDKDDATDEQFIFTKEDGTEITGTMAEIADKLAEEKAEVLAKTAATTTETKPEEAKKPEAATGELPFEIREIDPKKGGETFGAILERYGDGEADALAEIVPEFQELAFQTIAQDPRVLYLIEGAVNKIIDARETGAKTKSAFQEFAGEVKDDEVDAFMKANPWASTKEMAVLGIQSQNMRKELADLKAGKGKDVAAAEKKAKETAEKEAVRNAKAKGTLRRLSGGKPGGGRPAPSPRTFKTEDDRIAAQVKFLEERRQGSQ